MARQTRMVALFLCAVAFLMFAAPILATFGHIGHACAGVECEVCACILRAGGLLRYVVGGLALALLIHSGAGYSGESLAYGRALLACDSPIAQRTQLNR